MANEKRLIDANALADEVDESKHYNPHPQGMVRVNHGNEHDHFLRMILYAPTVDAVEVVHGRWIDGIGSYSTANCSVCGWKIPYTEDYYGYLGKTNYCPNCGAKMDGDGNG